ncbi:hypothetical protein ONZ45_g655 [Pleurotus djamor]|nr:hypothetical protein ONZ45_g655 [Pleurotus djamor]
MTISSSPSYSRLPLENLPARLTTLSVAILVAASAGTNYVSANVALTQFTANQAYGPQLAAKLHIEQTRLSLIGLSGNVGVYSSSPLWGRIVDSRGPRPLLASAFLLLLIGYSGIRMIYNAGPVDDAGTLPNYLFFSLMAFSYMTGAGGCAALNGSGNPTAKSFPNSMRATTTGLVLSGFGLSAFIFSTIAHLAFPGNTSSFLLVLAIGTSLPMLLGFFFIRVVPVETNDASESEAILTSLDDCQTPLLSDQTPSIARSILAAEYAPSKAQEYVEPDVGGWDLWKNGDFWCLFVLYSIRRIVIGLLSDFLSTRLSRPRSYCFVLAATLILLSQTAAASIDTVQRLWFATALLGLGYGSVAALTPILAIDYFGLAHFSEASGYIGLSPLILGNIFSIMFGRNLDAHQTDTIKPTTVENFRAGLGGIYQLHTFRKLGLSLKVVEAGKDLGGTWYWNCYPGARVDSFATMYQLEIDELWKDWDYSVRFPDYKELRQYFDYADRKLGLRRDIAFNTRVVAAEFDEGRHEWKVTMQRGEVVRCRYLSMCTGFASKPYIPSIKGLETFQGICHHTSLWPQEGVDLREKRVGIIGTGATAVQIIQEAALVAKETTVFQRTPCIALPMQQKALDKDAQRKLKANQAKAFQERKQTMGGHDMFFTKGPFAAFSIEEVNKVYERLWNLGGFHPLLSGFEEVYTDDEVNTHVYGFWRDKVRERINDPVMKEKLAPEVKPHPFGTKRPPLEQTYYDVFNQANVKLIDVNENAISEVVPEGITTSDGVVHKFDIIVLATGFDALTGSMIQIDIKGTNGITLHDKWTTRASTYAGLMTRNFPNMFFVYAVHGPTAFSNGPTALASLGRDRFAICFILTEAEKAEEDWNQTVDEYGSQGLWMKAKSWYNGANIPGKVVQHLNFAGGLAIYLQICKEIEDKGYQDFEQLLSLLLTSKNVLTQISLLLPPHGPRCPRARDAISLYRAWNPSNTDHFYTTNAVEWNNAANLLGYTREGVTGKVFPSRASGTIPLYRLWSLGAGDHFYTTNNQEAENAKGLGYVREGIAGWVFPNAICGSVPLYRTYSPSGTDHFYTTDFNEKNNAVRRLGYTDEGVAGYVLRA